MMLLIPTLEFTLGRIDTWPSNVIRMIILEEPTIDNIRTIVEFVHGNGIPFYIAHYFYLLCNEDACERATNIMRIHYVLWHCLKSMRHQAVYFKKFMWLNGRGLDKMEFVLPIVSDVPLGIDGTGRAFD